MHFPPGNSAHSFDELHDKAMRLAATCTYLEQKMSAREDARLQRMLATTQKDLRTLICDAVDGAMQEAGILADWHNVQISPELKQWLMQVRQDPEALCEAYAHAVIAVLEGLSLAQDHLDRERCVRRAVRMASDDMIAQVRNEKARRSRGHKYQKPRHVSRTESGGDEGWPREPDEEPLEMSFHQMTHRYDDDSNQEYIPDELDTTESPGEEGDML